MSMKAPPDLIDVIDPNQPGPFGVCVTCSTPYSDDYGFCQTCGHIYGFLSTPLEMTGECCFVHQNSSAHRYCVLCARPICDDCSEREGVSFASGLPTPQCKQCVARSTELRAAFRGAILESHTCARHRGRKATYICVSCALPHCPECSYFVTGGIFGTRLKAGPYCLTCFRTALPSNQRRRWISGRRAMDEGLVSIG